MISGISVAAKVMKELAVLVLNILYNYLCTLYYIVHQTNY